MQEQKLDVLYDRLNNSIKTKLDNYIHIIDKYKSNYILNNPKILYENKKQDLSNNIKDLNNFINKILESNKNRLDTLKLKLDLLNPDNILDKGYSIVYKNDKIVKNIKDVKENDEVRIMVKTGNIIANVKGVNKK